MAGLTRWLRIAVAVVLATLITGMAAIAVLWQMRASPEDIPLSFAEAPVDTAGQVTVTWLGITTLLFDDGETQIVTDATFSRFSLGQLLFTRLESDVAQINYALDEFGMDRVRAIIPLHSHFDHAIDAGHVANRTGAVILGSESTASIARGSRVPVDQYQILGFNESRYFGSFTVTLLESRHAPILGDDDYWLPGIIEDPLQQPARVNAWRAGASYAVLISHPAGTTLVQGSAGYVDKGLEGHGADIVMLSIAGLSGLGRDYTSDYWQQTVIRTGATRVYPIHFDNYTSRFGRVELFPDLVDDVVMSSAWLQELASAGELPVTVRLPRFGKPIVLY